MAERETEADETEPRFRMTLRLPAAARTAEGGRQA